MERLTAGRPPVRRVLTLLGAGAAGATSLVAAAVLTVAGPAVAQAVADRVTITGIDLAEPLEVVAAEQPELCAALHQEVDWLIEPDGDSPEPELDALGPQYTLVVHIDGVPRHRFHLYPLAEGGPRAFRPVEQPGDRTIDEGWFYGRLSMPDTLRAAGAPLTGDPATGGGGAGAGQPPPAVEESEQPDTSPLGFLDQWRQGMLLTAAIIVATAAGLGGSAYLIRRKI
ncbi:MAG: hypothetical protein GEV12_07135 [Micromonosporaceae bacterium]|nr:hypothetical protein [Micromonosporaceae bacterium]